MCVMNLPSIRLIGGGYSPPDIDATKPQGPADLAELLWHYKQWATCKEQLSFPASEPGLRGIIELAFYASMASEEGRYFRFNLVNRYGDDYAAARFDQVELDSVDAVRRLAPACTHSDCALHVIDDGTGTLRCDGLDFVASLGDEVIIGAPNVTGRADSPSLHVKVQGSGHLYAGNVGLQYEMRAGVIRPVGPFVCVPQVKELIKETNAQLREQLKPQDVKELPSHLDWQLNLTIPHLVFPLIAKFAVEGRRGGAFVILPGDSPIPQDFDVHPKHRATRHDLGADVVQFWTASIDAARKFEREGYHSALTQWQWARAKMLTSAEVVGNLSCIDGCVVLSRQLRLLGAGSEIKITDDQIQKSRLPFLDARNGKEWPDDVFLKGIGGTRHKSAARLCKAHPGIMVWVVSQDGELRVFSSDDKGIYPYGPLAPSSPLDW